MNIVTGAFGYIGRYITGRLLQRGDSVRTVTTHPHKPNPFGEAVEAFPLDFANPSELRENLRGGNTLYNTYWVRFEHHGLTFDQACENTRILIKCAHEAGIQKIVHISVTNASINSPLPYYRGKGIQEQLVINSGLSYSIVRPTLVFGKEDILVNNIAWCIRKFPFFPIFGTGAYRLRPVYVEDLARIVVTAAGNSSSGYMDAIGPEEFKFREFVELIASKIKPDIKLLYVPPALGIALGKVIGLAVRDVILTSQELRGLMEEMLTSKQTPNGTTKFSDWLETYQDRLGSSYTSELNRHYLWKPNKNSAVSVQP